MIGSLPEGPGFDPRRSPNKNLLLFCLFQPFLASSRGFQLIIIFLKYFIGACIVPQAAAINASESPGSLFLNYSPSMKYYIEGTVESQGGYTMT